ncbi:MAG: hypothetical protein JO015_07805 [Verrucomicrobia bacterium]|nr:hypothetical protein [Verrucomicrobiota bacterium]
MREPLYTTAGTKGRNAARLPRRTALNAAGVVVLLLGLICATLVCWGGRNPSAPQANDSQAYNSESGWTDDTLSPEDTKGSSQALELNLGKLGALVVNGWRQLEELPPSELLAATIVTASLLIASTCFLAAYRLRDP